jgi:dethiobiotin synthetase
VKTDFGLQVIFITGTDTAVGKTVLTALLLSHLCQNGAHALAIKPFCSGGRADAELLHSLQSHDLTLDEINPFHFAEPLAPLVAARKHNGRISLQSVLKYFQSVSARPATQPSTLLIEGVGGVLAPLGERFNFLDLILAAPNIQHPAPNIQVLVVAPNRLGTINHTMLTVQALQSRDLRALKVVLMDILPPQHSTPDTRSNHSILTELLSSIPLFRIPNLGKNPGKPERIQTFAKKYKKTLAQILA